MTMRQCLERVLVLVMLGMTHTVVAQQPDVPGFSELRPDGNGVASLRGTTSLAFTGVSAESALQSIATVARLNVTYDPALSGLRVTIAIAAHQRSIATALIEIGRAGQLRSRVSSRGDVIVDAAPRPPTPVPAVVEDTTTQPLVGLPALHVQAARSERLDFEQAINPVAYRVSSEALRLLPSFFEPDVLRSVQLLPGVESRSDWSAGFNVHGGEADQTLILLDGYPIYSPFHLGGVFSTFISSAVGDIAMYTGALPARYGGRLSGVLDISSALPISADVHGTSDVSLISASTSFGRTFASGGGAWQAAARMPMRS